eukprot:gene10521-16172_t
MKASECCVKRLIPFEKDKEASYIRPSEEFEVFDSYEIDENVYALGHGSYGVVCEATAKELGNERVAIKKITLTNPGNDEYVLQRMKSCWREIKLLVHFTAQPVSHILQLKDLMIPLSESKVSAAIENFTSVYVVLDLYQTSLKDAMRLIGAIPEFFRARLTYDILSGIAAVHQAGCVHRDLKPANLLIRNFAPRQIPELCLCDFGSGRKYTPKDDDRTDLNDVTTLWYRSPETLMNATDHITELSGIDIWSIGCIMTELISCNVSTPKTSRKPVFDGTNAMRLIHQINTTLSDPASMTRELQKQGAAPLEVDLILKMLQRDITQRISARDARRHAWFRQEQFRIPEPEDIHCAVFNQQCPRDFAAIKKEILEEALVFRPHLGERTDEAAAGAAAD